MSFVFVAALGCGGKTSQPTAPAPAPVHRIVSAAQHYRDAACACTTADCGAEAERGWVGELTGYDNNASVPSAEQDAEASKLVDEAKACRAKLGGGDDVGPAIAAMNGFADQMCACQDQACREKVAHDMEAWTKGEGAKYNDMKLPDDRRSEVEAIGARLGECLTR